MWLWGSFLMFQWPAHISVAVRQSWPGRHLGLEFELMRGLGRLSIAGMVLFVLAVLCLGLINANSSSRLEREEQ